jgi:hypothetical protein
MSKKYDVYSSEEAYRLLRPAALQVAKRWPELSAGAFWEEVRSMFWPRPDEIEMKALVLRMVSEGDLEYTLDWRVRGAASIKSSIELSD